MDDLSRPGSRSDSPSSRSRRGGRPDPADVRQLADSPVSLRRVARLFAPHRSTLGVVVALIVLSSTVSLAQPLLVRHVIDEALPRQDVRLLLALVGAPSPSPSRPQRSASFRPGSPPRSASR